MLLPLSNLKTFTLAADGLHSPSCSREQISSQVPQPVHLSGVVTSTFSIPHSSLLVQLQIAGTPNAGW